MKVFGSIKSPVTTFFLVSALYICVLLWADRQNDLSAGLDIAFSHAHMLLLATVVSYIFRFYRWWWLLKRAGHRFPVGIGAISYLAGFAYTATPGKIGELIRIRYFSKLDVPAECTFGAFIFERSCDLIAVLLLSLFIVGDSGFFFITVGFVLTIAGSILFFAFRPGMLQKLEWLLWRLRIPLIPKAIAFLQIGIRQSRTWLNGVDIMMGLTMGLIAWTVVGLSFVYLQSHFVNVVPFFEALSIYPLSMLVGAASMIPAGVGSTEATIILLLENYGVGIAIAFILAIVIRISTLWFGIILGFCAIAYLELYWN